MLHYHTARTLHLRHSESDTRERERERERVRVCVCVRDRTNLFVVGNDEIFLPV